MPTVLKVNGFRFFFFSNEHELEHIHIEIIEKNKDKLKEAWNEYFTK